MSDRVFHLLTFVVGAVAGGLIVGYLRPDPHTWMLVSVMVVGGIFGGGVNYFLARADDPANASAVRSLFVGVGAALLVPLFLHILSSNLLDLTRREPLSVLVFFGFCLIAAISSRTFITTISDRILRKVEEVEVKAERAQEAAAEAQSEVKPLVARQTEPEVPAPELHEAAAARGGNGGPVDDLRLLHALAHGRFALRSLSGLSNEFGIPLGTVRDALHDLQDRGLVKSKPSKSGGGERWFITNEGYRMLGEGAQL